MIQLYKYQQDAADQMASRVADYIADPVFRGRGEARRAVPFVQFLSSITASGKTVVLADAVAQIASLTLVKPVVLWMSKLTVVVEQSLSNLEPGGTYNDLIEGRIQAVIATQSFPANRRILPPVSATRASCGDDR